MQSWIYIALALAYMAGWITAILIDLLFLRPSYQKQVKHLEHENGHLRKDVEHWKESSRYWFDKAWDFRFSHFRETGLGDYGTDGSAGERDLQRVHASIRSAAFGYKK